MKKVILIILVVVLIILVGIGAVIFTSLPKKSSTSDRQQTFEPKSTKGFSLSPKSFNSDDFSDFFVKAKEGGDYLTWSGSWRDLSLNPKKAPETTYELAERNKLVPITIVQFFSQNDGKLIIPLNQVNKDIYLMKTKTFIQNYKPKYFGIGIEVNILYEKNPIEFNNFVEFFNQVYDEIKAINSDTKVFTVFQLERMKGLKGGIFGGKNDETKNDWNLLEKFNKADIFAFTTYPSLIYTNPSDIPMDYYSQIKEKTSKPIIFTEIGWHTGSEIKGFGGNEDKQIGFIKRFFQLTESLNSEINIWSFLYDPETQAPFNSMGLWNGEENRAKPGWEEWRRN